MSYIVENALIIQSDRSVLLEVHSPRADAARDAISPFAELIKSPEHIHTYQISPLSVWNARAAGMPVSEIDCSLAITRQVFNTGDSSSRNYIIR